MDLDFDKIFKITTTALYLNRSHPYIKRDRKWFLQVVLVYKCYSLLFYLLMYNLICFDLKANNFSQSCKNGVLVVVFIIVSLQYFVLIYHQKTLLDLINYIKKDFDTSKNLTPDEQIIIKKYANHGMFVCKLWFYLAITGFIAFPLKHVFLIAYHYYHTNELRLIPIYEFVYPSIMEDYKNNIYVYIFLYVYLNAASLYAALMYVAYVPLGLIMILHVIGQLEIAKTRIDNLFVCEEVNEEVIKKKLGFIVKRLQDVRSFVNTIMDVFKIAYDVTLKATTLILPVTVYEAIGALKHGELSLEFVAFIFGSLLISTSPCYYSQLLIEKGEAVHKALYFCDWERYYDRRTRTTLQILLLYTLRPIAIHTVFRTLCLEALTDLFQQSFAIFNFMNAMWE